MKTLHQQKCLESAKKARNAVKSTARKTQQKQASTLKKLRKQTWGY